MTANELIQYIIDNDKIRNILEDLGCHHLKEYTKEYRCGLPSYSSKNNVSIKKDTLKIKIYQSDNNTIRGNIFTLCQTIKNISFPEANRYIHNIFGLEYRFNLNKNKNTTEDPLEIFKKIKRKKTGFDLSSLEIHGEEMLKEYISYPHIEWIREGIMPWTCDKFKIGYSNQKKRIIIPERYWSGTENDYLGIMGRTIIKEYSMLDIPKYLALKPYPKSINLYGLQENYQYIQEAGYIVIAESQKSVLKRHSRNDKTVVAIGCHDISDEQVKIVIGLNVEVIIAMDVGVDINHIRSMCEQFYNIRKVSYIHDKYHLLKDKEAPMDANNKIYNYLFKYRIEYDGKERSEYLKWVEKQAKS